MVCKLTASRTNPNPSGPDILGLQTFSFFFFGMLWFIAGHRIYSEIQLITTREKSTLFRKKLKNAMGSGLQYDSTLNYE